MDIDQVRKVAKLGRLDLSDAELGIMATQLSAILGYVDQLQELNTDNVEPMAHPLPVQNVFRADELRPSLPVAEALKNAPSRWVTFSPSPPSSMPRTTLAIETNFTS